MACTACASGQYQDEVKNINCKICAIGRAQDHTGKGHCKLCQGGQYQDEVQKTTCKNCTANKYLYNYSKYKSLYYETRNLQYKDFYKSYKRKMNRLIS